MREEGEGGAASRPEIYPSVVHKVGGDSRVQEPSSPDLQAPCTTYIHPHACTTNTHTHTQLNIHVLAD